MVKSWFITVGVIIALVDEFSLLAAQDGNSNDDSDVEGIYRPPLPGEGEGGHSDSSAISDVHGLGGPIGPDGQVDVDFEVYDDDVDDDDDDDDGDDEGEEEQEQEQQALADEDQNPVVENPQDVYYDDDDEGEEEHEQEEQALPVVDLNPVVENPQDDIENYADDEQDGDNGIGNDQGNANGNQNANADENAGRE